MTNRCARMRVRGYIRILILSIHPFFPPDPGGMPGVCRRSSVGRAPHREVCAGSSPAVCTMAGSVSGDASSLQEYISCGPQKQLVSGNWYLPLTPRCNSGWGQDPPHLSTMCPRRDICRCGGIGRRCKGMRFWQVLHNAKLLGFKYLPRTVIKLVMYC